MKKTGDENIDKFIAHVIATAKKHGIKISLLNKSRIKFGKNSYCNGYFSETENKLVVGIDKPLEYWLPILVHEFCHLEQFIYNVKVWDDLNIYNTDSCTEFFDWVAGDNQINKELALYHNKILALMEFDCERRAVAKIKKYNLPIDIKDYIQKANAYVWFYTAVLNKRQWEGKKSDSIYIEEIYGLCPKTFTKKPLNPPKKFLQALDKYYF